MTREQLIAALERAEGPSRELDCHIQERLHPEVTKKPWRRDKWFDRHWDDSDPNSGHYELVPRYTSSLDAALTLFEKRPETIDTDPRKACIAALKARA